ncbi:splicing factor 3A subunit 1-like [Amphiura filiformis]|uniref:splicing factor 3A subunit 1-like n=1 Tax=Amphiura filiformis TaxID=82378 RepID=UPI003B221A7C
MPELIKPPEEVEVKNEGDTPTSKPMVGIIYPPPEVRNIVDKTAGFVARNGPEFETRIRQNEINNAKFNFLNPGDPYHAYYRHKVKDFQEGKFHDPAPTITNITTPKITPSQPSSKPAVQISEPIVPKEPPAEFEFVADPPSISAFELDVVKLTAQFVARNGRQFLTNLMNREQRNYLFDFLRPQHSMFNYFTKLVEQYTKVLIPPKDLANRLQKASDNNRSVMDKVQYRVQWEKHQEMQRKKEEEQRAKERAAYASIDWHDFVVVETVDFQPGEQGNFPPPLKPEDIGVRILAEERFEQFGEIEEEDDVRMEVEEEESEEEEEEEEEEEDERPPGTEKETKEKEAPTDQNTEVQDMEEGDSDMEESDEEEETPAAPAPAPPKEGAPMPPPLPPQPGEVQIRKDYDPKSAKTTPVSDDNFLISPITGEKIPADKMQEHMRIGLLDPHWIEQRNRQLAEKQGHESVFAPGVAIEESLKHLAERRTDIFGVGDVETQIGKKIGEEEDTSTKQKVIWDGHTASMEATTRKAQANISIEEQIAALHKAKGLLPDKEKEKIGPQPKRGVNIPPPHQQQRHPPRHPNIPVSKSVPKLPPPPHPPAPPKPIAPPPAPPAVPSMVAGQQRGVPVMSRGPPLMGVQPRGMMPMQVRPRPPMPQMMQQRAQFMPGPPMGMPRMQRPPMPGPPMMGGMPPRPGMPPVPGGMPPIPGGMPDAMRMGGDDGPPAKKAKTEESLIPEDTFLARNKGPVTFRVAIPNLGDKPEWKCNGQLLTFTLPLTDQVSVIKAKIFEELMMPAGKQKLQYEGLFIKDSNSLAFYNFTNHSTIHLGLKERGGRKR